MASYDVDKKNNGAKGSNLLFIVFVLFILGVGAVLAYVGRPQESTNGSKAQEVKQANKGDTKTAKTSLACEKATAKEVSKVLGADVKRVGGDFDDRNEPNFLSVCSYVTDSKPARTVTVIINGEKDEQAAEKRLEQTSKINSSEPIKRLGDQAIYTETSRQLVVRDGKQIFSVTSSESTKESAIKPQEVNMQIAKLLLK